MMKTFQTLLQKMLCCLFYFYYYKNKMIFFLYCRIIFHLYKFQIPSMVYQLFYESLEFFPTFLWHHNLLSQLPLQDSDISDQGFREAVFLFLIGDRLLE